MADTQSLIGRDSLPGERSYQTQDEDAQKMAALKSMGGGQDRSLAPGAPEPGAPVSLNGGPPMKFPRGQFAMPQRDTEQGDPNTASAQSSYVMPDPPKPKPPTVAGLSHQQQYDALSKSKDPTLNRTLSYVQDVGTLARQTVASGGQGVSKVMSGDLTGVGDIALSALGLFGMPFMYVGGEVAQTGIEANPWMRDRYHQLLDQYGVAPDDWSHPNIRNALADQVLKEYQTAAHNVANDPTRSLDDRSSAAALSTLLAAEQFAELGGPQGLYAVRNVAAAMAKTGAAAAAKAAASGFAKSEEGGAKELPTPQPKEAPLPPEGQLNAESISQRIGAPDTPAQQMTNETIQNAIAAKQQSLVGQKVSYPTSSGTSEGVVTGWTPDGKPVVKDDSGASLIPERWNVKETPPPDAPADVPPPSRYIRFTNRDAPRDIDAEFEMLTGKSSKAYPEAVAALMVRAYKANPAAFETFRVRGLTAKDYVDATAHLSGMGPEELQNMLKEQGFTDPQGMAGFVYKVHTTMSWLSDQVTRLEMSGAPESELAQAWNDYYDFAGHVFGMDSSWGHMGRAMQLLAESDFKAAKISEAVMKDAYATVKTASKAVDEAKINLADARVKGNEDMITRWEKSLARQMNTLDEAKVKYADATDAHLKKWNRARDLAYRKWARKTVEDKRPPSQKIQDQIKSLTPGDMKSLLKVLREMPTRDTGQMLGSTFASGALTSPEGMFRSLDGALLNVVSEFLSKSATAVVLSPVRAFGKTPAVELSEVAGMWSGLKAALSEFGPATKGFWIDGMRFEDMYGIPSFESDRPIDVGFGHIKEAEGIGGKAKATLGAVGTLGGRAHAYWHGLGSLAQRNMAYYGLAARDAARLVREGKATDAAAEARRIAADHPTHLTEMADRLAKDQSFTNIAIKQIDDLMGSLYRLGPDVPGIGKVPLGYALFVANRFMVGSLARGIEWSGGGLLRAGYDLRPGGKMSEIANDAITQRAKFYAFRDASEGKASSDPVSLRALTEKYKKDPVVRSEALSKPEIKAQIDYIQREAAASGVKGAFGATMLGVGLELYSQGHLKREGFNTIYYPDPNDKSSGINISFFAPFTMPFTLAAVIGDGVSSGAKLGHDIPDIVVNSILATAEVITDVSALSIIGDISDALHGRGTAAFSRDMATMVQRMSEPGFSALALAFDRGTDNVLRDPKGFLQDVQEKTPLWRRQLNPTLDGVGRPVPNQQDTQMNAADPRRLVEPPATKKPLDNPVLAEDQRLAEALPMEKHNPFDPTKLSHFWNNGESRVQLTDEQFYQYQKIVGTIRGQMLAALLQSDTYKNATDKEKLKQFTKVDDAARRQARRDLAVSLALNGPAENIQKYVQAAYNANGEGRRETALWAMSLSTSGKLTPPVRSALNAAVTAHETALKTNLTLDDYIKAGPALQEYLRIQPFNTGTPDDWARFQAVTEKIAAARRNDPNADPLDSLTPEERSLYDQLVGEQNDERAAFLQEHPEIARFVSGTNYLWVK